MRAGSSSRRRRRFDWVAVLEMGQYSDYSMSILGLGATNEAAKAACQQDFDQRVISINELRAATRTKFNVSHEEVPDFVPTAIAWDFDAAASQYSSSNTVRFFGAYDGPQYTIIQYEVQ